MRCIVKIDIGLPIEECPTFEFETMAEAVKFIRICFENDYDVFMKADHVELDGNFEQVKLWKDS